MFPVLTHSETNPDPSWTIGAPRRDGGIDLPLIVRSAVDTRAKTRTWLASALAVACIAGVTVLVFSPTRHNGFLQLTFDDQLILDDPDVRQVDWAHAGNLITEFRHANYVPLTMLTFALQYRFSGFEPAPYHVVNVLLHATTAILLFVFLRPLVGSPWLAALAALIFAVHPLQLEAVSLAIQRKTLLSGALFFVALIGYQHWCRTRSRGAYAAALLAFTAAAAAKPTVVTLPLVLMLYDYVFVGAHVRLADKLPFFAVAAVFSAAAMAASHAVGAIYPPHGGSWPAHTLVAARATMESVAALFLPLTLSPIYYYRPGTQYDVLNFIALAGLILLVAFVTLRRRQDPWSFFCVWWFILALLPQSNIFPLAQLRPDRYLYLSIAGFALWCAVALDRLARSNAFGSRWRLAAAATGCLFVAMLAGITYRSASIWRSDVSAWQRVVERHPWCATAHTMLGRAYHARGEGEAAERLYLDAMHLNASVADPYLYLAKLYAENGLPERAEMFARQFLDRAPGNPEGIALLRSVSGQAPERVAGP